MWIIFLQYFYNIIITLKIVYNYDFYEDYNYDWFQKQQ